MPIWAGRKKPSSTTTSVSPTQHLQEERLLEAARKGNLFKVKKFINNGINKETENNDGWTALHCASRYGHLGVVKYLIGTCHVDKNAQTNHGSTALHFASRLGYLDIVKYLISIARVKKETKDTDGLTALHFASYNGHLEIVRYLIETGHVHKEAKDSEGWTALHRASWYGHLAIAHYLIEACHVDQEAKTNDGWTALHCASRNGHMEIAQYLIETCHVNKKATTNDGETAYDVAQQSNKIDVIEYLKVGGTAAVPKGNKNDSNPQLGDSILDQSSSRSASVSTHQQQIDPLSKIFWEAANKGNLEKVKECIDKGIDKETKNIFGWTALHYACISGRGEIVKYLVETCGADKETKNKCGWTVLHYGCGGGHLEIVKYFVETWLFDAASKDYDGDTALHRASSNGHLDIVKYLVETCHADANAKNDAGTTALQYACYNGQLDVVKYLIDSCPVEVAETNKHGWTVLHFACYNGHLEVVQYLIESCVVDQEARNNCGWTTLHFASYNGHLEILQYVLEECNVDVVSKDSDGCAALHLASRNGHFEIVKFLSESCHVDMAAKTNRRWTAYHFAACFGHLDIVQYLIETCHIDRKAKNNAGETALHRACSNGHLDVVKYLVETCHINMETKNKKGETCYDVALNNNKSNVVKYLMDARTAPLSVGSTLQSSTIYSGEISISTDIIIRKPDSKVSSSSSSSSSSSAYKLNKTWITKLQDDNQELLYMLNQLGSSEQFINNRRDMLDLIGVEECKTIEDQAEQTAILSSIKHRDFYLLFQRKLKCMIKSCESLSTGMAGVEGGDILLFTAHTIEKEGYSVLKDTKLGFLIESAKEWSKDNLSYIPFIDTVGSIFHLIVTLEDEHDQYLGVARVASFGTIVCLPNYGALSLDSAIEKLARLIVRARCGSPSCKFVEENDEFGKIKQSMITLLTDSGNAPVKELASEAAECAFANIMKPSTDSILARVFNNSISDVGMDDVLAATIFGLTLEDLQELGPFLLSPADTLPNNDTPIPSTCVNDNAEQKEQFHEQEEKVEDQEETFQEQYLLIQRLSRQVATLEKKINKSGSRVSYEESFVYANPGQQSEYEMFGLHTDNERLPTEQRLRDQASEIDNLKSRLEMLKRQQA